MPRSSQPGPEDITPKALWLNRRQIIAGAAALGGVGIAGRAQAQGLEPNSYEDITSYNNYYEFGTGKDDPVRNAQALQIEPWSVTVDGLVNNPGDYTLAELIGDLPQQDRIYRFRCVEAWSMVVPWNGVELRAVLDRVGVQPEAKYVAFETVVQLENMIGV